MMFAAGCGRLDFGDGTGSGAGSPDASADAARFGACKWLATAPNPFTLSGTAFTYTASSPPDNTASVPAVAISAYDATTNEMLGTATSDAAGNYSIAIAGGVSRAVRLDLVNASYLTTHQYTGFALDADFSGYQSPLWGDGSIGTIYGDANVTWDNTKGNLEVTVEQCDGTPIEGATVQISPAPEAIEYLDPTGPPNASLTATTAPFSSGVGFNVIPGLNHVTAQATGYTFDPVDITIMGGEHSNVIVMHAYELINSSAALRATARSDRDATRATCRAR